MTPFEKHLFASVFASMFALHRDYGQAVDDAYGAVVWMRRAATGPEWQQSYWVAKHLKDDLGDESNL